MIDKIRKSMMILTAALVCFFLQAIPVTAASNHASWKVGPEKRLWVTLAGRIMKLKWI